MGPSCDQFAFHQGQAVGAGQHLIIGLTGLGSRLRRIRHKNSVFLGIFKKIPLQTALFPFRCSLHDSQVALIQFPVLDFLVHDPEGLCSLCCYDNAAGIPVDAVTQRRCKRILLPGPPFPLLVQVGLDVIDQRPSVLGAVMGMDRQTRPLIHQQDVVIFVDNVQFGRCHRQISIILPGFVKKLVIDI